MPRTSKLVELQPNKVYAVEGTVRFKHQCEGFTTLIIEQGEIQKKLKISQNSLPIIEGRGYRFGNCFYNSQGWLTARKPNESITPLQVEQQGSLFSLKTLPTIKQNFQHLEDKYLSTYLKVVSIQPDQVIVKNDKEVHLKILRGYSENHLVDITIWNEQIPNQKLINQWLLFEGIRIKRMSEDKFILVSTVFTSISNLQQIPEDQFFSEKINKYHNLSEIYQKRTIEDIVNLGIPDRKIFSIVKAQVKSIIKADYQGCPKCKRKIQKICNLCNINNEITYSYGKIIFQEQNSFIQVIIFDPKICELFKFAKQNCVIKAKVKTFSRVEDGQTVISHILIKVDSIFF